MIELPLIVLSGLLGSTHCLGMCGGFAVSVGSGAPTWRQNLLRQSAYGLGRIFTYSSLGAAAGFCGQRLVQSTILFNAQAMLAVLAGLLLLAQGTHAAGLWKRARDRWFTWRSRNAAPLRGVAALRSAVPAASVCPRTGMIGSILTSPGLLAPMLAGVMTGFLPCGLVYAMLALAVSSGSLAAGALTMAGFGLGTLPVMTAFGLGTSLLSLATRRRTLRLAAWCIVAAGGMSVVRGAFAWSSGAGEADRKSETQNVPGKAPAPPPCPLCRDA